jgi:lipopolysaccharide/colanic/teichoic acid biosynthesis glycosyltransferase
VTFSNAERDLETAATSTDLPSKLPVTATSRPKANGRLAGRTGAPFAMVSLILQDPSRAVSKRGSAGAGRVLKRIFDISAASIGLVALLPMLLVIAAAVRSRKGGSVFAAHKSVGRFGAPFDCYTFRTVDQGSEGRLGHMLRQSNLDSLPQLLNVLLGHMSCVGPPPLSVEEFEKNGSQLPADLTVKPGLSGAWRGRGPQLPS